MSRKEPSKRPARVSARLACLLTLSILAPISIQTAGASASSTLCSYGSGAGQCIDPQGVAIDRSSGRVYVADAGNNRVDAFTEAGSFLYAFGWGVADGTTKAPQSCGPAATPPTVTCFKGVHGLGLGQFSNPRRIAVDNSPTSAAFHDVYVVDGQFSADDPPKAGRVQRFDPSGGPIGEFGEGVLTSRSAPIAVGADGSVYAAENGTGGAGGEHIPKIFKFAPGGALEGTSELASLGFAIGIAVDSSGAIYVSGRSSGVPDAVQKYEFGEPSATLLATLDENRNSRALAVDAKDNLFVSQEDGGSRVVAEHDPGGGLVRRFGYGEIDLNFTGLAVGATGEVFGGEEDGGGPAFGNRVLALSAAPGPATCCRAAIPGNTKATIEASLNPEGKATTYHFDYVDEGGFKSGGFANPATQSTAETPAGSDFTMHAVEAQIGCSNPTVPPQPSCLTPQTVYHYRLVATNEDGHSEIEGTFITKPPFEIEETFASEVGTADAQLHATVNPFGIPANGYLEYVDNDAYQEDLAKGEGHDGFAAASKAPDVEGGELPLDFGSGETGKTASAQIDSLAPATIYHYRVVVSDPFVSAHGPELTFTTFPVPTLPANSCPNAAFRSGPSAALPSCRAYEMVSPVDKNGGDIKVLLSTFNFPAALEQSSVDGERLAYSSVTAFAGAVSAPWTSAYLATRKEGEGWATEAISPPRESKSLVVNIVPRFDTQYKFFSPDLGSGWLLQDAEPLLDSCAPAGFMNLYRRDNDSGAYEALTTAKPSNQSQTSGLYFPIPQGSSADGTHALFSANGRLTNDASKATDAVGPIRQVYEHVQGEGCGELRLVSVLPNGTASATPSSVGSGAGGDADSRLDVLTHAISTDGSRIYWSADQGFGEGPLYVRIDGKETIQVAAGTAHYWTAAADGSRAIYSLGQDLYEFDLEKALREEPASTLIAGGVPGTPYASEDTTRIYFVSKEALGGEGETGKPNLYLREAGATRLIATLYAGSPSLPGGDINKDFRHSGFAVAGSEPIANGVRVSPDGAHLAFVSAGSLTGYDNADLADGTPDLEVYLYDAESGHLACVSCNPSGARPQGRKERGLEGRTLRVSAQMAPGETHLFPRSLSEDGNRLFFESYEALLPRDTNGKEDVYEWQRADGKAQCGEAGAELYVPSAGGCLSLISSGQSPADSELADASADGADVFIRTASSLLPQDPGQADIYDARIEGGLPQPPPRPPVCEGETCQAAAIPPNDPTPASAGFRGAGNATGPARPRCAKGKARRKGRCVAKKKRHARRHAMRANDNRRVGR